MAKLFSIEPSTIPGARARLTYTDADSDAGWKVPGAEVSSETVLRSKVRPCSQLEH
jgi:hypothetical protein